MNHSSVQSAQRSLSEFAFHDYSAFSQGYEDKLTCLGYRTPALMADFCAKELPGQGRVLDLGCGTGLLGKALHQRGLQASLVGLDLSPSMLEQVPDGVYAELQNGDCCQPLVYGNNHFQAAVSSGLSEYVLDLRAWFTEVRRVLSEGSLWAFSYALSQREPVKQIGQSMLVSHARDYVRFCLAVSGFAWQEDADIEAYHSGGELVTHVLTKARARVKPTRIRPQVHPLPAARRPRRDAYGCREASGA